MKYRVWFRNNAGTLEDMGDRVLAGSVELGTNAEQGSVGSCSMVVDDTTSDFLVRGHRKVYVLDAEASGDAHAGVLWVGYTANREVYRGNKYTGAQRMWTLSLNDINTVFERRIMHGSDAKRPEETDVARVQWLYGTNEMPLVDSDLYLSTASPVTMDKADLRGQTVKQIIDDCAQQSGKNYYLIHFPLGLSDPTSGYTLWYGHDDPDTVTALTSDIRISNVLADVDNVTTFEASYDSKLTRDPSRVYSGVRVEYDGGFVYVQRPETADDFALGGRDTVHQAPNIKSKARAIARGTRMLRKLATEEDHITTAVILPPRLVNVVMAGYRMQVKFSHLPGYEDFVWMRVVGRTVRDPYEDAYVVSLELATSTPEAALGAVYGILRLTKGPFGGIVYFQDPGDTPPPGYPVQPTMGALTPVLDADPPNVSWPYTGWKITGTGTVDVRVIGSTVGVLIGGVTYTVTWSITKNGVAVVSDVASPSIPSGLAFYKANVDFTTTAVSVVPNDVIAVSLTCAPAMPFFRTPAGTGQVGERLEITGGSLV